MQQTGLRFSLLALIFLSVFVGHLSAQNQLLTGTNSVVSQNLPGCLTDLLLQQKIASNPAFASRMALMNQQILDHQENAERSVLTIPVVVHIIHTNGIENIPDQQVIDGMQHLNDAFANTGAFQSADGVNTNIQFCLAVRAPDGTFTSGITHTVSNLTNVNAETQDADLKSVIQWDPNHYLNIWLVKEITSTSMGSGIAGYAYFPTSQGHPEDGIVNEARFFGSSVDNSKIHIHEAGHYLGLYHTFEGGCTNTNCQTDGDRVCDTPPDNSTAPVNCGTASNTCTSDANDVSSNNPFRPTANGGLGDQPDLFKDYMDYGYQNCQTLFTPGQSSRMNAALSSARAILLESDGCLSPCIAPMHVFSLTADTTTISIGQTVNLTAITSATSSDSIVWTVNSTVTAINTGTLSQLFSTPGTYVITITVSNQNPACSASQSITIQVNCPAQASFQLAASNSYMPGQQISAVNTSTNATFQQWHLDGNILSSATNWQQTFPVSGGHSLYLVSGNDECSDTSSTKFFQIGSCDFSGVTNHWVMQNTNLFFNNGTPTVNAFSPYVSEHESSSAISDANGNLLFFSDGVHVWDRNYTLMPNGSGLLGHLSSTQGVLITPHPGNTSQYFLFTNSALEDTNHVGLFYNIIDMTLNGGMGDILPSAKNISLLTYTSEKLNATWHANGRDIWVSTSRTINSSWYSFLIDNTGVHPNPVISDVGILCDVGIGAMRFSHDGNRMAAALICQWPWRISVYDFNKATGQFSNPIDLMLSSSVNLQIFSLEFSPDNSKLYASTWQGSSIFQYDLENTTAAAIMNSRFDVDPYDLAFFGQLLLAPNGKIYAAMPSQAYIDVINYPNLPGAACGYQTSAVSLPISSPSSIPLNNTLSGYFNSHSPVITGPLNICKGGTSNDYGISFETASDSSVWSHSGPGTLLAQNGNNVATLISANSPATDTLRVNVYGSCGISHDTIVIHTNTPEITSLPDTILFCNAPILISPGDDFLSYEWQNNTYADSLEVTATGMYWVRVKGHSGCIITDTTSVQTWTPGTPVNLGSDRTICQGQTTTIQSGTFTSYQWQDGSQNSSFTAYLPGHYWVTVSDGCFYSSDSILVTETVVDLNLNYAGNDTLCKIALPFTLSAPASYDSYSWSNGATSQSIDISSIGVYSLVATTSQGCNGRDTLWVIDCLSLDASANTTVYRCFPNPADNLFTIESLGKEDLELKVFSVSGQLVKTHKLSGTSSFTFSTADYAAGVYLIELKNNAHTWHQKLIIHHH